MRLLSGILCTLLLCSSCRQTDGGDSGNPGGMTKRQKEIAKMIKDHYRSDDHEFEVRGPLTVEECEQELARSYEVWSRRKEEALGITEAFEDSKSGKAWARFKSKYVEGDEFYLFTSDRKSWGNLRGTEGYVLIRKNELIDGEVTVMN